MESNWFLDSNNVWEMLHSGFRPLHSSETVAVEVKYYNATNCYLSAVGGLLKSHQIQWLTLGSDFPRFIFVCKSCQFVLVSDESSKLSAVLQ